MSSENVTKEIWNGLLIIVVGIIYLWNPFSTEQALSLLPFFLPLFLIPGTSPSVSAEEAASVSGSLRTLSPEPSDME